MYIYIYELRCAYFTVSVEFKKYVPVRRTKNDVVRLASRAQNLAERSSNNRFPRGSDSTVHRDVPFRYHVSGVINATRILFRIVRNNIFPGILGVPRDF